MMMTYCSLRFRHNLPYTLPPSSLTPSAITHGPDLVNQLHQVNQIIDSKLRLPRTNNLERVRGNNARPLSRHRRQTPALVVEVDPLAAPVTAILEVLQLLTVSWMKRVRYQTTSRRTRCAGCSPSVGLTPA